MNLKNWQKELTMDKIYLNNLQKKLINKLKQSQLALYHNKDKLFKLKI